MGKALAQDKRRLSNAPHRLASYAALHHRTIPAPSIVGPAPIKTRHIITTATVRDQGEGGQQDQARLNASGRHTQ